MNRGRGRGRGRGKNIKFEKEGINYWDHSYHEHLKCLYIDETCSIKIDRQFRPIIIANIHRDKTIQSELPNLGEGSINNTEEYYNEKFPEEHRHAVKQLVNFLKNHTECPVVILEVNYNEEDRRSKCLTFKVIFPVHYFCDQFLPEDIRDKVKLEMNRAWKDIDSEEKIDLSVLEEYLQGCLTEMKSFQSVIVFDI